MSVVYIRVVQFSCKITHAIITYLESEKIDLSAYFSDDQIPWEKLRDSSVWMRAPDMEALLERIIQKEEDLIQAGHNTPKSKAWGVLDSVLRMMPAPQEIFQQPEKFLGYFISPEPPLENIFRYKNGIRFDIPLPAEQYPMISTYLKAAFEALPKYVGLPAGTCKWNFLSFDLQWPEDQPSILDSNEPHQLSKHMLQDIVGQLQKTTQELEERNHELQKRNDELMSLLSQDKSLRPTEIKSDDISKQMEFLQKPVHQVAQNLSKLHDYMVRAHQLVTLLTAHQKQSPGIKQALHRVDWDIVKQQYPQIILESLEELKKFKNTEK